MKMITTLLKRLVSALKNTASSHRKKLIFAAIMLLGLFISKKCLKPHHLINAVMFFVKFWGNIINLIPMPKYAGYRDRLTMFEYQQQLPIPEISDLMNLSNILAKVKSKQPGSLDQLKFSIISGVIVSFVLYNAESFYDLVLQKYIDDFKELSAEYPFQYLINQLKINFKTNFKAVKQMIQTTLHGMIGSLNLQQTFDIDSIENLFKNLLANIFKETERNRILAQNTHRFQKQSTELKKAENYFKTTLQFIQPQEQKKQNKILNNVLLIFKPISWIGRGLNKIIELPEEQLSGESFFCHSYIYILPLKKYHEEEDWPSKTSSHLSNLVLDEMSEFFRSTNFCTFSKHRAEHMLLIFTNRLKIYFIKKAGSPKKKLLDLLPIFSKILKQQLLDINKKNQLYERQIAASFKDVNHLSKSTITDIKIRNKILQEIYRGNQLKYLNRDIQIKYFNERENIMIHPKQKNLKEFNDKDQIRELMQSYGEANDEEVPQQMIQRLKDSIR